MITTCISFSQQEVLIRNRVLLLKTNWKNLGGAKRKEETPAHNMSY